MKVDKYKITKNKFMHSIDTFNETKNNIEIIRMVLLKRKQNIIIIFTKVTYLTTIFMRQIWFYFEELKTMLVSILLNYTVFIRQLTL